MAVRQSTMGAGGARQSGERRLLPAGFGAYVRRRLIELLGVGVAVLAAALLVAIFSHHAADPSLNRAAAQEPRNLLGLAGAYTSDFLLQGIGLTALLGPLLLLAWAWRLVLTHRLPQWGLKLALAALGSLLLGPALATIPTPAFWPFEAVGLGGLPGDLIARELTAQGLPAPALRLGGLALGAAVLIVALGITWREYRAAVVGSGRLCRDAWRRGAAVAGWIAARRRRETPVVLETKPPRADRREPRLDRRQAPPAPKPPAAAAEASPDLVAPPRPRTKPGKKGRHAGQGSLDFGTSGAYELPPLLLLEVPAESAHASALNRDALEKNARLLETVLQDFGIKGEIVKVRPGPVVTRYDLEPAPGTKTSRVVGLADDIARSMSAISVRVAVVPGSSAIGIELPNGRREIVYLRELLGAETFERAGGKLPLILGKDISGAPTIVDLARMPHLLIAGTTGSGKSVSINALILSLLYRFAPDACKFIMIDPKMLELSVYDGIPHLLSPVVTEPKKAVVALKWTVREMEDRYRAMSRLGVRNIDGYNARIEEARRSGEVLTRRVQTGFDPDTGQPVYEEQPFDLSPLPYIVVVVDEMADLMLVAGKDIEAAVQRLAQMARAAGIHLIMATQRPSVDVITGTIKANFPTRISFHVTSKIDSRTILGETGAEQLLGQGDMLYMGHGGRITRVHGPLVTDQEVEDVVAFLKRQGQPTYIEAVTEEEEQAFDPTAPGGSGDELYDRALAVVCQQRKASTSFVQRHLQIGYNRAARIIERMEAEGVVSPANHVGKREVLIDHAAEM